MAMSAFLSSSLALSLSSKPKPKPHFSSSFSFSPRTHSPFLTSLKTKFSIKPKRLISAQSDGSNSPDAPDRLISALCYFLPLFDGIRYGKYVINQYTPILALIQPLLPSIEVYESNPLNAVLVFLSLYVFVVKNPNFSRFVRFNTMQALVLDFLLIFPDLLLTDFDPKDGLGLDVMMSLYSTVFLFLLISLIYGSGSCFFGQVPRLPFVAEAAERELL